MDASHPKAATSPKKVPAGDHGHHHHHHGHQHHHPHLIQLDDDGPHVGSADIQQDEEEVVEESLRCSGDEMADELESEVVEEDDEEPLQPDTASPADVNVIFRDEMLHGSAFIRKANEFIPAGESNHSIPPTAATRSRIVSIIRRLGSRRTLGCRFGRDIVDTATGSHTHNQQDVSVVKTKGFIVS